MPNEIESNTKVVKYQILNQMRTCGELCVFELLDHSEWQLNIV